MSTRQSSSFSFYFLFFSFFLAHLLKLASNTTNNSSHIPSDDILQFADISQATKYHLGPGSHIPQMKQEDQKETADMELLGKEFGVLKVDPAQTVYHGGQHWVSTMFQV
jgi:hypothetical protein